MADWFSSLASQAMKLADDFTESLVAQANEAQDQIQREQTKLKEEEDMKKVTLSTDTQLPWETQDESLQILSDSLMDSILKLSLNERNFTSAPPNAEYIHFVFSDFIATALHLLKLDSNLAHVHSKVSPKMDEELFWRNYYARVIYLRAACGIDGGAAQEQSAKWSSAEIVFEPDFTAKVSTVVAAVEESRAFRQERKSPNSRSPNTAVNKQHSHNQHDLLNEAEMLDGLDELDFTPRNNSRLSGKRSGSSGELYEDGEEVDEGVEVSLDDLNDDDEGVVEGGGEEGEEEEEELDLGDLDDELDLLRELREMQEEEEAEQQQQQAAATAQAGKPGTTNSTNSKQKQTQREVGDLGSYEEVGKSDCNSSSAASNAELEAQIAAELANISDDDE